MTPAAKNVRHTRATAWTTLILATLTSLAGNVYHATTQPGSGKASIVAAVAVPIFLLLGIHLIGGVTRARADRMTVSGVYRTAVTAVVTLVAIVFAASFIALRDVLVAEGSPTWIAVIVPVAVDLAIGVATLVLFALKPAAEPVAEAAPVPAEPVPAEPVPAEPPRRRDTAARDPWEPAPAMPRRGWETATTAAGYREPATEYREPVTATTATTATTVTTATTATTATAEPATTATEYREPVTATTATRFSEVRYSAPTATAERDTTATATPEPATTATEHTATTADRGYTATEYTATTTTTAIPDTATTTTPEPAAAIPYTAEYTATPATEHRDTAAPVTTATEPATTDTATAGHRDRAAQLVADGKTKQSADVVAAILAADAAGTALNSIAKQVGKHHTTVRAVLDAALTAV
jgi:hypothetical protein